MSVCVSKGNETGAALRNAMHSARSAPFRFAFETKSESRCSSIWEVNGNWSARGMRKKMEVGGAMEIGGKDRE